MIKSIIFDFDGVILDSNKAKGIAFVELFKNQNNIIKKFMNIILITLERVEIIKSNT